MTVEAGTRVALDAAGGQRPRPSLWRGRRFIAEVFDGADDALAALEAVQDGLASTGFQTLNWLTLLYEELSSSQRAVPRLVVVTERNSGRVALVLPLIVKRKRSLRVARFADLDASIYGGPILGPAVLKKPRSVRRVWRAVRRAMRDIDLIQLRRMPAEIGRRINPLVMRRGVTPSRRCGHVITVPGSVEEHLEGLGKKYRKEAERCHRLLEGEGGRFYRATSEDEVVHAFSILEEQQAAKHAGSGRKYILDNPPYRAFYERLALDGSEAGLAALFALEAKGEIIATLFGIEHEGTFTLLRMSTAGEAWSHLSPGRLVVIEAMKHFVARGVRRFDMGTDDDPFERGLGADAVPLYDLIVARDLAALPRATFHRLKGRLRSIMEAREPVGRLRPRFGH